MSAPRKGWVTASLTALLVGGCGPQEAPSPPIDAAAEVGLGAAKASRWVRAARRGGQLSDSRLIGVGYLERARLGLGSPFRLAEFALTDPRVTEADRRPVAASILQRTLRRQIYAIDSRVLDGAEVLMGRREVRPGSDHVRLIERTIREAEDPRAGELAVRVAYALAGAEGVVKRSAVRNAIRVAALLRDRELARRDALALLAAAEESGESALTILPAWRADGGARVEEPLSQPPTPALESEGLRLAALLVDAVRNLAGPGATRGIAGERSSRPLLAAAAATRLAALANRHHAPPRPAISLALESHATVLRSGVGFGAHGRVAARRFLSRATTEEALAAELVLLNARTADHPVGNAVALWSAVGTRAFAQERPWFPGSPAPLQADLAERHGIAGVTFDASVAEAWRPYYLAVLDVAVSDLRRVMPTLRLDGLRIHVGAAERTGPLALHDPGERRLYLPPLTGAGTLAHEIAHDLDWQVALRRYHVRGDYGTDRSVRGAGDSFATSVRGLAAAASSAAAAPADGSHWARPAEVFARGIDWFSVVALGHEGRMNGYLSSVQDDVLTGYGTVPPPDVSGKAGGALVAILDDIAPVYAETREWFLSGFGPGRAHTAMDLLRLALADPRDARFPEGAAARRGPRRLRTALRGYELAADALDAWICLAPGAAYGDARAGARRELIRQAARSVARGLALERGRALAGDAGRRWLARRLYGRRWREEPVPEEVRPELEALLEELETVERALRVLDPDSGFRLSQPPDACGGAPAIN
ncbi:MAG: hypothetical protein ABFS34_02220 [Gemmatimonadota bacterium]